MFKKLVKKVVIVGLLAAMIVAVVGCSSTNDASTTQTKDDNAKTNSSTTNNTTNDNSDSSQNGNSDSSTGTTAQRDGVIGTINLYFGEDSKTAFPAEIYDNDTAAQLLRTINGSVNLPIYHYDDFDDADVMQYFDVSSNYDIKSSDEQKVTEEKAGEIYFSAPDRVMLFYQDANVEGNFTKIGQVKDVSELKDAVESNPVLKVWRCKIIVVENK